MSSTTTADAAATTSSTTEAAAAPTKPEAATTTTTTTKSVSSSTNYILVASYATLIALWVATQFVLVPYVVHLLILVTCILYAACHESIVLLHDESEIDVDEDGQETVVKQERETLKQEDAYQFPLVGSASLFGLYCAFKFLDKDWVNLLIGGYFAVVGAFAVAMTLAPALGKLLPFEIFHQEIKWVQQLHHPFTKGGYFSTASPIEWWISVNLTEIIAFCCSVAICAAYFLSKPWYLNNVLGMSFCLQGIERFSLGTYKIGAILLVGLFFYDIFWVFATEVMVSVAKNLDGPIKILFPRTMERDPDTGKFKDLSLLGLGDIVIPGFFLALLLRFDAHRATEKAQRAVAYHVHDAFPKPYFHSALAAYVAGLGTTLFVMLKFDAAQPALLYLVPACLGSSFLCAKVRGEIKELLAYSEEEEEEEEDDEDAKEGDKGEDAKKDD